MKILPQIYLWTRKNWLNFGSHPLPDPDPGIFWRILQHCEIGHFSTIRIISLDKVNGSSWKFCHICNFRQGSPHYILDVIRIWSAYPDSRYRLWIGTRFALAEVCALWVLVFAYLEIFIVEPRCYHRSGDATVKNKLICVSPTSLFAKFQTYIKVWDTFSMNLNTASTLKLICCTTLKIHEIIIIN